jgi:acetyl esterase/lipase
MKNTRTPPGFRSIQNQISIVVVWMRVTHLLPVCGLFLTAVLAGCADLTFGLVNTPARFGSFNRIADVPYGPNPRERLDVYVPKQQTVKAVVIFWFGGSWQNGRKEQYRFVGAALAQRGILTVIPDYRLYPEVRFPELMEDGAKAVAWVHEHARDYSADPERLVLMGHSAGGHMAALLALDPQYLQKAGVPYKSIVGLVGLSGPYALDPNTDVLRTIFGAPFTPAEWQPVGFVSSDSPPTLLLHGLNDTVVDPSHARALQSALEHQGVPVETHFYPRRSHIDTVGSFSVLIRGRTPALEQTVQFVERISR